MTGTIIDPLDRKLLKTPSKRGKELVFINYNKNTKQLMLGRVVICLFARDGCPCCEQKLNLL